MTPDAGQSPIKLALALLFDHPELLTLDPSEAARVQQLIVKAQSDPHFADVWQYISAHPLDSDEPWADLVPIALADGTRALDSNGKQVRQWNLSPGICAAIEQPLATLLAALRSAPPDPTPGGTSLPTRFGLRVPAYAFDVGSNACTFQFQNVLPRHLGVYVEFFAEGIPIVPTAWASRLPAAARDFLENDTIKFLGMLPPVVSVAGMPATGGVRPLTFDLPGPGSSVRLTFGGPGLGNLNLLVAAGATLVTAVLDFAVPVIMDGAHCGLASSAWFNSLLTDPAIEAEILGAARFLFTGPSPADSAALWQTLSMQLPRLLLGKTLPTLQRAIAANVGANAATHAAAVLGWADAELAAQAGQPSQAAAVSALLSAPATFVLDLSPVSATLEPDPRHGMWPDRATAYELTGTSAGGVLRKVSGALPVVANAPVSIMVPAVPAGGQLTLSASVVDASGTSWGDASAPAAYVQAADQAPQPQVLMISEKPAQLTPATHYLHRQKLIFDPATDQHRWQVGPAPTAVGLVPTPGAAFRDLRQLTLQESSGDVGYAWQTGDQAAAYEFATIGVVAPETRAAFSGPVFSEPAVLAYVRTGPNLYLDPTTYSRDRRFHLRGVSFRSPMSFDLQQTTSFGSFAADPDRLVIHPGGWAIGCFSAQDVVASIALPAAGLPVDVAPDAAMIIGPGTGIGAVNGPAALAVTSTGVLLVLEQGSDRIQAFDPFGNAIPHFAGATPALTLASTVGSDPVTYLDLAVGPGDALYILSRVGASPQAADHQITLYGADGTAWSSTTGVAAARLLVDDWGRIYTLNYEALNGPGGRPEPTISQWLPAD